jgi:hypothetical protein
MNEAEKQIVAQLLKKIEDAGDGSAILNYLRFLEAVRLRIAIDDPTLRF